LHLGHIRNILLGDAVSKIRDFAGDQIVRVQIINDRGIAICKSMLAWKMFSGGSTPSSEKLKPDHFVGDYYVLFEKKFQQEYAGWQESDEAQEWYENDKNKDEQAEDFFKRNKNNYFNTYSDLGKQARQMLLDWEKGNPEVVKLWKQMNDWVYEGFDMTYDLLNVQFDQLYFESETYLLGKEMVIEGLKRGLFYKEEDGSVWVDLSDFKLDKKILLRSDGTSVYITQDMGTAEQRYRDHEMDGMAYVVADEQNYHFKVLFALMKLLNKPFADRLYHLSYGMVDLPEGKMKSREGTVVDADDLIEEVKKEARSGIEERGNLSMLGAEEIEDIVHKVALGALKYFIVKVNPQKRMVFNPAESVDMQGQTGPYIQYSYVRIKGLLEKARKQNLDWQQDKYTVEVGIYERDLLVQLVQFPELVVMAARDYDPSAIANYAYKLAKSYHKFWTEVPIFKSEGDVLAFRLSLSEATGLVVSKAMELIGIEMPQKM
jgi:arginyl-tRNA synthetase